jgi:hypothetical protein
MRVLVRKMKSLGFLRLELILGVLVSMALIIGVPALILSVDITLITNPYVLGFILTVVLISALIGYFRSVRPYILFHRYPDVLVETDGEFLYIHADKEAKIPISQLTEITVTSNLPFIVQKEFISEILIHFLSEEYGDIYMYIKGFGKYRIRFVSHVTETAEELSRFVTELLN